MNWELFFSVYLALGIAHALVWAVGSAQKYRDIWFMAPSFIVGMVLVVVVAWPAFFLANLVMLYQFLKNRE